VAAGSLIRGQYTVVVVFSSSGVTARVEIRSWVRVARPSPVHGLPIRWSNFQEQWTPAIEKAGIPGLHFHDLRHTGNTFAAESGATLYDLMDRMGHATTRAALIYIHKTAGRDKKIADALSS
jgi:integrase